MSFTTFCGEYFYHRAEHCRVRSIISCYAMVILSSLMNSLAIKNSFCIFIHSFHLHWLHLHVGNLQFHLIVAVLLTSWCGHSFLYIKKFFFSSYLELFIYLLLSSSTFIQTHLTSRGLSYLHCTVLQFLA